MPFVRVHPVTARKGRGRDNYDASTSTSSTAGKRIGARGRRRSGKHDSGGGGGHRHHDIVVVPRARTDYDDRDTLPRGCYTSCGYYEQLYYTRPAELLHTLATLRHAAAAVECVCVCVCSLSLVFFLCAPRAIRIRRQQ